MADNFNKRHSKSSKRKHETREMQSEADLVLSACLFGVETHVSKTSASSTHTSKTTFFMTMQSRHTETATHRTCTSDDDLGSSSSAVPSPSVPRTFSEGQESAEDTWLVLPDTSEMPDVQCECRACLSWFHQVFTREHIAEFARHWVGQQTLLLPVLDAAQISYAIFGGDAESKDMIQRAIRLCDEASLGVICGGECGVPEIRRHLHILQDMTNSGVSYDDYRLPPMPGPYPLVSVPMVTGLRDHRVAGMSEEDLTMFGMTASHLENCVQRQDPETISRTDFNELKRQVQVMTSMMTDLHRRMCSDSGPRDYGSTRQHALEAPPCRRSTRNPGITFHTTFDTRQTYKEGEVLRLRKFTKIEEMFSATEIDLSTTLFIHCCVIECRQRRSMPTTITGLRDAANPVAAALLRIIDFASPPNAPLRKFYGQLTLLVNELHQLGTILYRLSDDSPVTVLDRCRFSVSSDVLAGKCDGSFDLTPTADGVIVQNVVRWYFERFVTIQQMNEMKNEQSHGKQKRRGFSH